VHSERHTLRRVNQENDPASFTETTRDAKALLDVGGWRAEVVRRQP
jgi:hypothetical protein